MSDDGTPPDAADRALDDLDDRLDALYAHLEATAQLPVRPSANRWLGEAEAVAADLARSDLPAAVVRERAGHVVSLLERTGETGSDTADERVAAALAVARRLAAES